MATDSLSELRAAIDRARAGEDATAALLEHLEAVQGLGWSEASYAVTRVAHLALLAGPTFEGVVRAIQGRALFTLGIDAQRPSGLLLRDGDPLNRPFPENPWGIPPTSSLEDALARVWAPVRDEAGAFFADLEDHVVGLALYEDARTRESVLGYILFHELDRYEIDEALVGVDKPPRDRRSGLLWEPFGDVAMIAGRAPSAAERTQGGLAIPAPLAAFYRVHGGLRSATWRLSPPDQIITWSEMLGHTTPQPVDAMDDAERILSSDLLSFFSYGDDRSALFHLTGRPFHLTGRPFHPTGRPSDPPVRIWSDGRLSQAGAGAGEPFWDWFDRSSSLLLLFDADEG